MTDPPPKKDAESPPPQNTVTLVRWWVAAVAALSGLLIGVLATALLLATTPQFGTAPDSGRPQGADQQTSDTNSVPVVAQAQVNAACLRVINEAQDVVRILSGVDEAATDVDLQRLDDIVRRLQPVEARLQRDLRQCRVDTSVTTGSTAAPAPTQPQPSATPR
jgi:hypothetical protein